MDRGVAVVDAYLQIDGYFTPTELPVIRRRKAGLYEGITRSATTRCLTPWTRRIRCSGSSTSSRRRRRGRSHGGTGPGAEIPTLAPGPGRPCAFSGACRAAAYMPDEVGMAGRAAQPIGAPSDPWTITR